MKVNGIIAEYNPFHNGHLYHLEESLKMTGADYTVVVMSGNFVQRGAPALLDKHTRARMALLGGADLVLEIPSLYATSSAEYYANGSVSLLTKLGVVTHLCFGSECGDVDILKRIAEILVEEPADYSATLKRYLKQGMSYPNARTWALMQHYPEMTANKDVFSSPNNILGISYLKSLLRQRSSIEPVTLRRAGSDYHDKYLSSPLCSSLAIRQALYLDSDPDFLKEQMPVYACDLLKEQIASGSTARSNDFSAALYYKLLSERDAGYEKYLDVSSDLSDRIQNHLNEFKDYESFCDLLKTKEMTYTRISRCLLHIFLNITAEDMQAGTELGYTPYARVLGFRESATPLLGAIKENSSIPLVTKLADAEKLLNKNAFGMLKRDTNTSQLYYGVISGKNTRPTLNEYTIPLVII